jgi:hypothetical protein
MLSMQRASSKLLWQTTKHPELAGDQKINPGLVLQSCGKALAPGIEAPGINITGAVLLTSPVYKSPHSHHGYQVSALCDAQQTAPEFL